jgi:hypothetical protein
MQLAVTTVEISAAHARLGSSGKDGTSNSVHAVNHPWCEAGATQARRSARRSGPPPYGYGRPLFLNAPARHATHYPTSAFSPTGPRVRATRRQPTPGSVSGRQRSPQGGPPANCSPATAHKPPQAATSRDRPR